MERISEMLYRFTVLTRKGFGDVTPMHPVAHAVRAWSRSPSCCSS
jgi:hypothetical protein